MCLICCREKNLDATNKGVKMDFIELIEYIIDFAILYVILGMVF